MENTGLVGKYDTGNIINSDMIDQVIVTPSLKSFTLKHKYWKKKIPFS